MSELSTVRGRTLAQIPLFVGLDDIALRRLESACAWVTVGAKQWVIDPEAEETDVFFVVSGHLWVTVLAAGRERILREVGKGEFFGELSAIDSRPRSTGIVAATACLLARMPASAFQQALRDHASVSFRFIVTLVTQVRASSDRANEALALPMKHRLAAELLRLARIASGRCGTPIVSPPPTHAELACRIGSQREAVTREINAMARAGLISRRRGSIALSDVGALRRMVQSAALR